MPARRGTRDDGGGVLKDYAQHDEIAAVGPVEQDAGRAYPEVGLPGGHHLVGIHVGAALPNLHVETSVAIEPLLKRSVISGELKLMLPFQLQRNLIECSGRLESTKDQAGGYDQPFQNSKFGQPSLQCLLPVLPPA